MSLAIRFAFAAALSLFASLPARAQQVQVEVAPSLICDTKEQAERFASLFDGNQEAALKAVNAEANDPTACAVIPAAFVRGGEVGTTRSRGGTFRIVRILVLGVMTDRGLLQAAPQAFFSIVPVDEREA
jgi:hypothetical protein